MKLKKLNILAAASFLGAAILPITNLTTSNNFIDSTSLKTDSSLVWTKVTSIELPEAWVQIQYSKGNRVIPSNEWKNLNDIVYNKYYKFSCYDDLKRLKIDKEHDDKKYYPFELSVDDKVTALIKIKIEIQNNKLLFKYSYDIDYLDGKNHTSDNDYKIKIQIETGDKVKLFDENNTEIITDNINLYDTQHYYTVFINHSEKNDWKNKTLFDTSTFRSNSIFDLTQVNSIELPEAWVQIQYSKGNEVIQNKYWKFSELDDLKTLKLNKNYSFFLPEERPTELDLVSPVEANIIIKIKIDNNRLVLDYTYDVNYLDGKDHTWTNDFKVKIQIDPGNTLKWTKQDNNEVHNNYNVDINYYNSHHYHNFIVAKSEKITKNITLFEFNFKKHNYEINTSYHVKDSYNGEQFADDKSYYLDGSNDVILRWKDYAATWDEFKKLNPSFSISDYNFRLHMPYFEPGITEYPPFGKGPTPFPGNPNQINTSDLLISAVKISNWANDGSFNDNNGNQVAASASVGAEIHWPLASAAWKSVTFYIYIYRDGDYIKIRSKANLHHHRAEINKYTEIELSISKILFSY